MPIADPQSEFVPVDQNGGWNQLKGLEVHLDKESVGPNTMVIAVPTKFTGKGPELQFQLEVFDTRIIASSVRAFLKS